MPSPKRRNPGAHPLPRLAEVESAPENPPGSYLRLLPIDPHRLFAYWKLSDKLLQDARHRVGRSAVPDDLLVRIFQMDGLTERLSRARDTETFPVHRRSRQIRMHLSRPNGYAVAILGAQDREGRFYPLIRSARVALPVPPATPDFRPAPKRLDETITLQRAAIDGLPPELLRLPGTTPETRLRPPGAESQTHEIPLTPALDERQVVDSVLNQTTAEPSPHPGTSPPGSPEQSVSPAASSHSAPSSHSLAGNTYEGGAPLALHAVLVAEGFPQPDEQLVVAGIEGKPDSNGRCCWNLPCDDFAAAWKLLKHPPASVDCATVSSEPTFTVEFEGVVRDPAYLAKLPRGVTVDSAGRFRAARPLPHDHALVPKWSLRRRDSSAA